MSNEQPTVEDSPLRKKLLELPNTEDGITLDFGGDKVFVLGDMTEDLWLVVRKMGLEMKGLDAACLVVNTLKHPDSPDPTKVLSFKQKRALEQAIMEWTEPAEVIVKKNTKKVESSTSETEVEP